MNHARNQTWIGLAVSVGALSLGVSQTALAQNDAATTRPHEEPAPSAASGLPVPYVERPLTLPEMTLAPEFGVSLTHSEFAFLGGNLAINLVNLGAGASFGIIDDLTAYVVPLVMMIGRTDAGSQSDTEVFYGTFRVGAIYRFLHTEAVDIGAQAEVGATGFNDLIHLTARLPILLRLADVVRIDTGFAITGFFPLEAGDPYGGIASLGNSPSQLGIGSAGVPVDVAFQVAEPVFLGLNTGIGLGRFDVAEDTFFSPLGAFVGGTVADGDQALLDIKGSFLFPFFLISGDPEPPLTEVWQVGLDARAYIDLGG